MPKSELVKWSATYSVGIKLIDDQHKGLLNLVNDLFNHVSSDEATERAYFQKVIQTAVNYVKVHFATEEKIMLATKFPGYAEHKKAHDTFVLTVVDNIRDFEAGKKFTLAGFTRFLKDWVLTHIAIMDKQYFTYFKNIATRKSDGRLTINRGDVRHG
ncbi:MAG: bacteriohemerythrin [Treponema sp.]|jgi:hemerythrin|nr:bacteriohemerythrin [Treponema sp.]MDR1253004.1 bacteriohemerythrin [Treponema sp.]